MQDTWLDHFKAAVDAEIKEANGHKATAYRAVASKIGLKDDYVYQVYQGKPASKPKRPSVAAMNALARAYANGRSVDWINRPIGKGANSQSTVELTETLISADTAGEPGGLILRLVEILAPLSPWLQESAVKLIAQTVASPDLAVVNAAKFEDLLKLEAPAARNADESNRYALDKLRKTDVMHESPPGTKQRKEN